MAIEKTLIVVKPDGFKRRLTGEILSRFEDKGLQIRDLKLFNFTQQKATILFHTSGKTIF
jgi:nucleoside-diphosphate kinase